MVALQAWVDGTPDWSGWGEGHYAVVIGVDPQGATIAFEDPVLLGSYATLGANEFMQRWHDEDEQTPPRRYQQLGIVFAPGTRGAPPAAPPAGAARPLVPDVQSMERLHWPGAGARGPRTPTYFGAAAMVQAAFVRLGRDNPSDPGFFQREDDIFAALDSKPGVGADPHALAAAINQAMPNAAALRSLSTVDALATEIRAKRMIITALRAGTLTRGPSPHAYTYAIPYALDAAHLTVESPRRLGRPVIVKRSAFEARWAQVLSGGKSHHRLCVVLSASRAALPPSKPMG